MDWCPGRRGPEEKNRSGPQGQKLPPRAKFQVLPDDSSLKTAPAPWSQEEIGEQRLALKMTYIMIILADRFKAIGLHGSFLQVLSVDFP